MEMHTEHIESFLLSFIVLLFMRRQISFVVLVWGRNCTCWYIYMDIYCVVIIFVLCLIDTWTLICFVLMIWMCWNWIGEANFWWDIIFPRWLNFPKIPPKCSQFSLNQIIYRIYYTNNSTITWFFNLSTLLVPSLLNSCHN